MCPQSCRAAAVWADPNLLSDEDGRTLSLGQCTLRDGSGSAPMAPLGTPPEGALGREIQSDGSAQCHALVPMIKAAVPERR